MQKFNLKNEWRAITLVLAGFFLSIISYPYLPERVVSHWNFYGQADGWMSRSFNCWLFPLILLAMYLLFWLMPKFDPKKERYAEFSGVYIGMRDAIIFIFFCVFTVATIYNLGYPINVGVAVATLIGLLMMVLGNYFGKLKRNWFIGIRTPWTLSSENVWNKTHRLGGRLFMVWGALIILAPWLPMAWGMGVLLGGIALILIFINIFSYRLYKKEQKK
ncbi:MAG: SdpI family protein [Patescibacteria group bacterium]